MSDYIPPELISNILARLAVVDVLRCTSVCKSWYSLITSSFASSHLDLSSPNQHPRLLVSCKIGYNKHVRNVHQDSQLFDKTREFDPSFHPTGTIIDSFNGLVCLYLEGKLLFWNPSIRKSLILPDPRFLNDDSNWVIGFGFVAASNDYKVVWFQTETETGSKAEIYQLSTGSWRNLKLEDSFDDNLNTLYDQAHLKGVLHWIVPSGEKVNPPWNYIFSFDLENEEFGTMMIPSCLRHDECCRFMLSTFRESLYLIDRTNHEICHIWMMKEFAVDDSWEKLFIVDKEQHPDLGLFLKFRYNGEILFEKVGDYDASDKDELVSYDCKNNQVKNLGVNFNYCSIHTYVESLVLINGRNDAKIEEEYTKNLKNMQGLLLN